MKRIIITLFAACICFAATAQKTARYGEKFNPFGYEKYISKDGFIFTIGDTVEFGENSNVAYSHIMKDKPFVDFIPVSKDSAGKKYIIDKFMQYPQTGKMLAYLNNSLVVFMEDAILHKEILFDASKTVDYSYNSPSISFYENYRKIYKYKVTSLCLGIGGTALGASGSFLFAKGIANANPNHYYGRINAGKGAGIAMSTMGGFCMATAFVFYIMEINEYKKIRDKHEKIRFTGDGVIINLN